MQIIDPDDGAADDRLHRPPYDRFSDPAYLDLLKRVSASGQAIDIIIAEDGEQ